ncbi:MAG: hypothetical protein ACRC8A_02940 [Microcoleaceae cyanobacterium]
MKTITLPENLAEIRLVFEQANDEDVIIKLADGRQFMLSAIIVLQFNCFSLL